MGDTQCFSWMILLFPLLCLLNTIELNGSNNIVNIEMSSSIPKILHYAWMGGNPKPPEVVKCIESWFTYCKDWLIVEWNDFALKGLNNTYISEAYSFKKWAFVADYIRLYALVHYGGVYVDADVELLEPIDAFLNASFFIGRENWFGNINFGPHLMGAVPHNKILSDILSQYRNEHFLKPDGTPNYYVLPKRFKRYFRKNFGIDPRLADNETTIFTKNSYIFPWWYFCTVKPGEKAWAVHHFHGSWTGKKSSKNETIVIDKRKDESSFRKRIEILRKKVDGRMGEMGIFGMGMVSAYVLERVRRRKRRGTHTL